MSLKQDTEHVRNNKQNMSGITRYRTCQEYKIQNMSGIQDTEHVRNTRYRTCQEYKIQNMSGIQDTEHVNAHSYLMLDTSS